MSDSLRPPWMAACQASLSFTKVLFLNLGVVQECLFYKNERNNINNLYCSLLFRNRIFNIFKIYFLMKNNCSTVLCWFLPNRNIIYMLSVPFSQRPPRTHLVKQAGFLIHHSERENTSWGTGRSQ